MARAVVGAAGVWVHRHEVLEQWVQLTGQMGHASSGGRAATFHHAGAGTIGPHRRCGAQRLQESQIPCSPVGPGSAHRSFAQVVDDHLGGTLRHAKRNGQTGSCRHIYKSFPLASMHKLEYSSS